MKALFRVLLAGALVTASTGCEDFIDINDNPNQATSVTPDALLASALATTAANYTGNNPSYNSYASFAAGYWGKSGTVSGFAEEQSYNYTSNYYQGLFTATYDNLNDYNIIQQGAANGYTNHAAIARIMKVYNFQLLVDQYGNIPYSAALQGKENLAPAYDKDADIYRDFVVQLKGAVADIDAAAAEGRPVGAEDVVFGGNMTRWKQFANSLLLRVLLRESQTNDAAINAMVRTEMAALQGAKDGFIDRDVVVQPGYTPSANQQNPFFNRYGFAPGLTTRPTSEYSFIVPTNYIIAQYQDNNDPRITQLYRVGQRNVAGTETATPGYVGTDLGESQPPQFNPAKGATVGSRLLNPDPVSRPNGGTFLRGANAPTVLMLLAEQLFSQAEAETRNLFTGGDAAARSDFENGIKASFLFTYRLAPFVPIPLSAAPASTATAPSTVLGVVPFETYIASNVNNPLVNYTLAPASSDLGNQAVIIYQKYLAANTVASTEAWANFRRTGQPKFKISVRSGARLPARLFYPQTEVNTNAANVPQGIDQYTKIFWDVVD